ncbi:TPA: hypothetical protein ACGAPA_003421 [Legionella pneumophila]|uniref:hypothetical protein n=1 Tax=Legionella pneumophila TaxID=446 RepID=UPI0007709D80|nr:hypothetical protein [Legionella pneumophila]HAT9351567.1 hypothetical protein [Legionella pneumophila subsp. pneumophila]AOU50671.1 hypothetical protein A9E85_15180 [Legionella pneumophila]MDW8862245.1 hypothetical protein [Legionella pneumophila]MDW8911400.1 hypothetical protein [Legionella pneumophila]CZL69977.1 Uncharacterised protein [Legionella pneumophila]
MLDRIFSLVLTDEREWGFKAWFALFLSFFSGIRSPSLSSYSYRPDLMNSQDTDIGKGTFDEKLLQSWREDLEIKDRLGDYYFAIDLVVAVCENTVLTCG